MVEYEMALVIRDFVAYIAIVGPVVFFIKNIIYIENSKYKLKIYIYIYN